ncbi:hypothetical protein QQP08_025280 [Theobroma cacao]|nr:hypothetical protein QQP08_025280 [Theobroma cacao]
MGVVEPSVNNPVKLTCTLSQGLLKLQSFLLLFKMKDKDATPFLAMEKEGHEVKKSDKDSLV